ncbi:MAG: response regulator, partial [Deltaproteobacteria bacterium]|nr:response regulator [Deltaproteobacteria bacterium]
AGGIAHDFNNILAAIMGNADMASYEIPENSPARYSIDQIIKAGFRARDLVTQILTFSRQSERELIPVNVSLIVKEALKLVRSSFPSTIEIKQRIDPEGDAVMADPTQLHQVLMNLCANARHTMREEGGVLEVSLGSVDIEPGSTAANRDVKPGSYLRLAVSDTGPGMEKEIKERIFDPYFTTKVKGEGTGLGLAVVLGIVKNYGGSIFVDSEVGQGTTFEILFPLVESRPDSEPKAEEALAQGHEMILFVDDEEQLCDLGVRMLNHLGYQVEAKTDSIEALELFRSNPDQYDMVITDMTMPHLTGEKLAKELRMIRPGIPIILCTGFSEMITEEKAKDVGINGFIQKPIGLSEIAQAIRNALI